MPRIPQHYVVLAILALPASPTHALGPDDVYLLTNVSVPASREIADHYCQKRGVPKDHVITLDLPAGEDISRKEFDTLLATPLRQALNPRRNQVKVLITTYGVPLRVGGSQPAEVEKEEMAKAKRAFEELKEELSSYDDLIATLEAEGKEDPPGILARTIQDRRQERERLRERQQALEQRQRFLAHAESQASVDSELSLLWWNEYDLRRWQPNMLHFQVPPRPRNASAPILMVSRLDGPTPEIAKRLVDQAVETQQKGLAGKVYVDARGIKFDPSKDTGYGYGGYDESLREMAQLLKRETKLDVTLDDQPELFVPGSCTDCALYCGWYSHAKYVDCCRFVSGAVAYHIASSEAVSLRRPEARYWCKCLLDDGVAATLGPVAEPYTVGFPKPAEFFGLLVTGKYTLVECYYQTLPLSSWMTVLVGDPLYNPFAKTPLLSPEMVKPSPAGGKFLYQFRP